MRLMEKEKKTVRTATYIFIGTNLLAVLRKNGLIMTCFAGR
jgi:hypothetical protein